MISINKTDVIIDNTQIDSLQEAFQNSHSFVISHFFNQSLQSFIEEHLSKAEYHIKVDTHKMKYMIAKEYKVKEDDMISKILNFYLNKPKLIEAIKRIVQLDEIHSVIGRIYKFEDDDNCFDNWHDDLDLAKDRLLGFSINLSSTPFVGGEFILREKQQKKVLRKIKHDIWGNGHFFRIHSSLEHMVNKVRGKEPRIAYAGWFVKDRNQYTTIPN